MTAGDFHFATPSLLCALAILPLLIILQMRADSTRRILLSKFLSARLQPRLAGTVSLVRRRISFLFSLLSLTAAILAAARPQWGATWEDLKQKGRDLIIAIDTSRSMLAQDLRPDRLARAKLAAQDLLSQIQGDRVGVIAFAGVAFLQAPLTPDHDAVREAIDSLDTEIIPRGGTNLTAAIREAVDAFGKGESKHQALIIFSDGEDLEQDAVSAARENKDRLNIFTVGLGSSEGAAIPVPSRFGGTEFVRDEHGELVKSHLDETRLREVANAGGGFYIHLQSGPAEISQIVREGLGSMNTKESDSRVTQRPIERYQWPLGAAILCLLASLGMGEQRRAAAKIAAFFLLLTTPLKASESAAKKYTAGDYRGALESYDADLQQQNSPELHFNAGDAAYQLGDYERASASFSHALGTGTLKLQAQAAYNLANTLARRGNQSGKKESKLSDWRDALQHYNHAIQMNPSNKDAEINRNIVQKAIEQIEKQEKQEKQEEKSEPKKEDKNPDPKQKQEDQKQEDQKQEKQPENSQKGEEKQPDKKGESEEKNGKPQDGQNSENPELKPQQNGGDEKKEGELKPSNEGQNDQEQDARAQEAAEAMAAASEGRMTEKDANALLESLRRLDVRGRLSDPDEARKLRGKNYKNW